MYLIPCLTLTVYSTLKKSNRCFFLSCYSFFFPWLWFCHFRTMMMTMMMTMVMVMMMMSQCLCPFIPSSFSGSYFFDQTFDVGVVWCSLLVLCRPIFYFHPYFQTYFLYSNGFHISTITQNCHRPCIRLLQNIPHLDTPLEL